jgi:TolB protein
MVAMGALAWPGPMALAARSQDIIAGTSTGVAIARVAVPEFVSRSADNESRTLTALLNETLWNDLEFSGVLQLVSRSFYPLGVFGAPPDIAPADWTTEGVRADFLTFGNTRTEAGEYVLEARLWDLQISVFDREVLGLRYTSRERTPRSVRLMAHTLADDIVEILGAGIRGVAKTQIAFESRRDGAEKAIYVMDYDGENSRQITPIGVLAVTPNWSPDGTRIAYTSYELDKPDIAVISPTDRRGYPFERYPGTTSTPAFSPDGMRVAFASSMGEARGVPDPELYVADSQGRNPRRLTNSSGVDMSPCWNPRTGQQLAFVSDRSGPPQVYVMDAEGGNLRRIDATGGDATDPSWSPNGETIAFSWQPPSRSSRDIYLHNLATGRNTQLTRDAGYNENPSWSPDSRHLVFESDRDGTVQLYSMLADGSRVRRLTSQGRNSNPSWSNYMG